MASTTTIRLEESLRARLAEAADRAGKTAHAFIIDAIAESVDKAELEEAFHRVADERWARLLTSGRTVPSSAVRGYLEARARGESPTRPKPRKPQP
jgi:predicted transcriptional regulator